MTRLYVIVLILLCVFNLAAGTVQTALAAEKVFIKEYTYQASEADSKLTSRAMALEQAKRLVLEELGTYLISKTEVRDFALMSDKITVLTAGVVQTEIFDEKWDGIKYYLKARIKADPDEVAKAIDRLRKDEGKTKQIEDAKRHADELLTEIGKLNAELDIVRNDRSKQIEYANKVNALSAANWIDRDWSLSAMNFYDRGVDFQNSNDFDSAIEAYSKAIKLDPTGFPEAYHNRGLVYKMKDQYDRAIEDYNKAISLKPDYYKAYYGRGVVYQKKRQYDRAIEDYSKAISLNPEASAYYNRGTAYLLKGQNYNALADFKKSCELGDNDGCENVKIMEKRR